MRNPTQSAVRLVEPADLPVLAHLLELWSLGLDRGMEPDLLNQLTLVAERGGRPVGCISALVGPSKLAYVDNLVVEPRERKAFLAYTLLSALECVLARLGWSHIQACVSLDRPEILAYAERLGYLDYGLHHILGKPLSPGSISHG